MWGTSLLKSWSSIYSDHGGDTFGRGGAPRLEQVRPAGALDEARPSTAPLDPSSQREEIEMKRLASRDNPSDALTKFAPGELLPRRIQWFGYSYLGQHDGQDDVICTVEPRLRCFAKHLNLARQRHGCLTQALSEGNGLDSWGGTMMAFPPQAGVHRP